MLFTYFALFVWLAVLEAIVHCTVPENYRGKEETKDKTWR